MAFAIPSAGGASSTTVMSGASPYSSPQTKMTNLFNTIDLAGSGTNSKQQFSQAFATLNPPGRFQSLGANTIFSRIDPQNTGLVSKSNFISGMTGLISSFGQATSTAATLPSQSISQSQQLLESLGSPVTSASQPGSAVNKIV